MVSPPTAENDHTRDRRQAANPSLSLDPPRFNLVHHNHHGVDTAKYGSKDE